jgi:eukaryotic-like serine/threonine-protein kinase
MAHELIDEKAVFNQARGIASSDERLAYLQQACAGNAETLRRILDLLRVYDQEKSFLESPPVAPSVTMDEPVTETPGTMIGAYKLLERIGEGGFGVVYMAEQTEPVRRKVALKVLKAGMDTRQVVARFEAERQALAIMDHPNIAKVHDGGTTPSGRPYFVMELVRGVPITEFCDQNHLTPRQRLDLFIPVCQAVQHAHQKGIIHRDLKPSNILVAMHDTTPVPKVIDFGIAKALGQELTDKTLFTGFAQMVGTPLYMSPEQAGQSGLDIDTRSDIYSLGVLLYELLTGTTPFDKERFKQAAYDEIRRIIREEDPPRPSTRLSSLGSPLAPREASEDTIATRSSLASVAAQRHTEPVKLTKLVRGELDWIVMKALEKDRNRRYETANGLAADVQRYLADEPVQACPPSAAYRLGKFARRNKGALAMAGLVLFFVMVFGSGVGWAVRDRAAREEERSREWAERQARVTTQAEVFLADVERLENDGKWVDALAEAKRAEAVLASGEADPGIQDKVRQAVKELEMVRRLEQIRMERAAFLEGEYDYAGAVEAYARAFREFGVDVESLPTDEAIARLGRHGGIALPLAAALDEWVFARSVVSNSDAAGLKRLVAVARGIDPDPLRDQLRERWGQKTTLESQAQLRRLAESIDVRTQHPATLRSLARTLGRPTDAAVQLLRQAQSAHPGDFWLNSDLGWQLSHRKDYEGAIRFHTAAVAIRPNFAAAQTGLGVALLNQKKLDEAITCFRKAIEFDPKFAPAHNSLGVALDHQKKLDEAITCFRKATELDPKYASFHNNLGIALQKQGRLDEAIACYHKAIELFPKGASFYYNLGLALRNQGKLDEAIAASREAIRLRPDYAEAQNTLGIAPMGKGQREELPEILAQQQRAVEAKPDDAAAQFALASTHARLGQWQQASAALARGLELDSSDHFSWYRSAALHLQAGDVKGYRRGCREMLARFGETDKLEIAERTAKACLLLPDAVEDSARVQQLAAQAVRGTEKHRYYWYFMLCKGLADHRAGRHVEAIRWLERCSPKTGAPEAMAPHQATAFAILSMAQHRLGDVEKARLALTGARTLLARAPDPARGRPFGADWHDWLQAQILYREAEALLKKEAKTEGQPSGCDAKREQP